MLKQALKFGGRAFKGLGKQKAVQIGVTILGMGLFQKYKVQNESKQAQPIQDNKNLKKDKSQLQNSVVVEEDAIYLNKQTYMSKLLGNKHEDYILIVYAQENQEDTTNSIKTAKHIKKIIKEKRNDLRTNTDINVYVVSRPTLEDVKKMANRIMDFKIFEREDNPEPIEIYIKTVHSNDYVHVKWRRESFYTDYKSNKFVKKLDRYLGLFDHFQNTNNIDQITVQEQQLADLFQKQYVKLNEPVILKCSSSGSVSANSTTNKQQQKELKLFKKLCFTCMERKLIPLKSRLVVLENKEIMRQLNLEDNQIYILRNDMVQKLENSQEISQNNDQKKKIVVNDEFMYIPNRRNQQGKNEKLAYFANHFESYQQFKKESTQLMKSIDTLSRESGNAQNVQELEEMKDEAAFVNFIMPRITFLRDAKFGSIGKLFKKITFSKEKHVLALNLQSDDKQSNHSRILTFRKLYEQYKNEFTFLMVDTDELVDLFPHMEANQPQFSVFNFFNIDKSLSKVGKYYKHLIFPFEKYFLRDSENFYEDFTTLQKQVDNILLERGKKEFVINQQDMIPQINSEILDSLLKSSIHPFVVQILDETPNSRLSQFTLNQLELERLSGNLNNIDNLGDPIGENKEIFSDVKFYRMGHLNQHPFLKGRGDHTGPIYLFINPSSKQVILAPSKEQVSLRKSREEFVQFLSKCKVASSMQSQNALNSKINQVNIQSEAVQSDLIAQQQQQQENQGIEVEQEINQIQNTQKVTDQQKNLISQYTQIEPNNSEISEDLNQLENKTQDQNPQVIEQSNSENLIIQDTQSTQLQQQNSNIASQSIQSEQGSQVFTKEVTQNNFLNVSAEKEEKSNVLEQADANQNSENQKNTVIDSNALEINSSINNQNESGRISESQNTKLQEFNIEQQINQGEKESH